MKQTYLVLLALLAIATALSLNEPSHELNMKHDNRGLDPSQNTCVVGSRFDNKCNGDLPTPCVPGWTRDRCYWQGIHREPCNQTRGWTPTCTSCEWCKFWSVGSHNHCHISCRSFCGCDAPADSATVCSVIQCIPGQSEKCIKCSNNFDEKWTCIPGLKKSQCYWNKCRCDWNCHDECKQYCGCDN